MDASWTLGPSGRRSLMIPEAFHDAHDLAGLITVIGFLTAFFLTKVSQ